MGCRRWNAALLPVFRMGNNLVCEAVQYVITGEQLRSVAPVERVLVDVAVVFFFGALNIFTSAAHPA